MNTNKKMALLFNTTVFNYFTVFSDVRVRKAFNYAIDREALVKYTLQGEGDPALHGLIPKFKGIR